MKKTKMRFGRLAVVWVLSVLSGVIIAGAVFPNHKTLAVVVTVITVYTAGYRYCFYQVDSPADPPS